MSASDMISSSQYSPPTDATSSTANKGGVTPLSIALSAIPVLGNVASSLINNYHNEQLVKQQNKMALEQWNRENLYNSPVEQVKRLKEAGLNPNLMYGNGAGSLLSAPSPDINASKTQAPQIDPLTAAQIRNLDAQSKSIEHQTDREDAKQPFQLEQIQKQIDSIQQGIDESIERMRNLSEDTRLKEVNRLNVEFEQCLKSKQWQDAHALINAQIEKLGTESKLNDRQFEEMVQTFVYRLSGLEIGNKLNRKQIEHYDALIKLLGMDYNLSEQKYNITKPEESHKLNLQKMYDDDSAPGKVGAAVYDGLKALVDLVGGLFSFGARFN